MRSESSKLSSTLRLFVLLLRFKAGGGAIVPLVAAARGRKLASLQSEERVRTRIPVSDHLGYIWFRSLVPAAYIHTPRRPARAGLWAYIHTLGRMKQLKRST